ncbi:Tyrosine-protein kinase-like otk [Toxocara canis]|uniref:Tyrosine-protein kinase-like otk n=1 Tax=Toxocara canis TaxID=6265 RepID=A0A0B2VXD2_TOXCA|nr:Tyrosine-protein kinase-like otk [Toxocara canis]
MRSVDLTDELVETLRDLSTSAQLHLCKNVEYSETSTSENSATSSNSTGNSDSGSSILSWASTSRRIRNRKIDELLDSLPFFFGSMLDDPDLQTQLLAEPGDTFLVSYPLIKEDAEHRCTAYRKWHLVILEPNEIIFKLKVVYRNKLLRIASERNTLLLNFINDRKLKLINRPWNIQPEQITPKMRIVPQQAFPINVGAFALGTIEQKTLNFDTLRRIPITPKMRIVPQQAFPINVGAFALGTIEQKTLNFDTLRRIPVMQLTITDCSDDEIGFLLCEAQRRKRFGSVRIWRLWGVCESDSGVSLILEDIVYGSVAEYVRVGLREYSQLIYGNDLLRWIPPECLPHPDGPKRPYDSTAMVYSFGTVIWSMFHGAAMPYEDEQAANIIDRNFRASQPLFIEPELVPEPMREVILRCWSEDELVRGRFRDIKWHLRKVRNCATA